jgi:hypothetical protein
MTGNYTGGTGSAIERARPPDMFIDNERFDDYATRIGSTAIGNT